MSDAEHAEKKDERKPRFSFGGAFREPVPGCIVFHLDLRTDRFPKGRMNLIEPMCEPYEPAQFKLGPHSPGQWASIILPDPREDEAKLGQPTFIAASLTLGNEIPADAAFGASINFIVGERTYACGTLELAKLGWFWRNGLMIPCQQRFGIKLDATVPTDVPARLYLRGEWGRAF